jgi:hypothetical protein
VFFLVAEFLLLLFLFFFSLQTSVIVFFGGREKKVGLVSVVAVVVVVCVCVCGGVFFFLGVHLCRLFCYICMQKFMLLCVFPSMLARKWWRRWWFCDDEDDGSVMKMMMVLLCTREWASRGIGILCDGGYGHGFQEYWKGGGRKGRRVNPLCLCVFWVAIYWFFVLSLWRCCWSSQEGSLARNPVAWEQKIW